MQKSAFEHLRRMEGSWWYAGRKAAVRSAFKAAGAARANAMLDFGAGYGGMASLARELASRTDAYEPSQEARRSVEDRQYDSVFVDETEALVAPHDLIGMFDVLEHIQDDRAFLARARGALSPGGRMLITVPAYQTLWSDHDVTHQHFRRYTKKGLVQEFVDAGFLVEYASYWNMAMLIPAALLRLVGASGSNGLVPPPFINRIVTAIVTLEAFILRFIPLPFGLSLVLVARVPKDGEKAGRALSSGERLVRYGITGVAGAITQAAVLYVWVTLLGQYARYLLGLVVGFLVALALTFILQRYWTFAGRTMRSAQFQFIPYTIVALTGLALNAALLAVAKAVFEYAGLRFFAGWYVLVQLLIAAIVSLTNFVLNSRITFRHRTL